MVQLIGRYKIIKELGKGSMGVVYLAKDPVIDRMLAVKTIRFDDRVEDDSREEFLARFYQEARAAGKLNHPGIVTVFDTGFDENENLHYILMEYVPGHNIKQLISDPTYTFSPEAVQHIGQLVCDALHYAHEHDVIHRDIKPANIILTKNNQVKITDFGIAKIPLSEITMDGQMVGTPAYMSPEQVRGRSVDHRTDQFSLGVTLYEMLAGERPFTGGDLMTVSYKITHDPHLSLVDLIPDIPGELARAIDRSLSKQPDDRFESAHEMGLALKEIHQPVSGEPDDAVSSRPEPVEEETLIDKAPARTRPLWMKQVSARNLPWILLPGFLFAVILMIMGLTIRKSQDIKNFHEENRAMANQLVLDGEQMVKQDKLESARKAFAKALLYDSENAPASRHLQKIERELREKTAKKATLPSKVTYRFSAPIPKGNLVIRIGGKEVERKNFDFYSKGGFLKLKKKFEPGTITGSIDVSPGNRDVYIWVGEEEGSRLRAQITRSVTFRPGKTHHWTILLDKDTGKLTLKED